MNSYDFSALTLDGVDAPLSRYRGHPQEPGTEARLSELCSLSYGVSFPMFAKIKVNGSDAHPLYEYSKSDLPRTLGIEAIKMEFTKILVGKDGAPIKRYAPADKPASMEPDIEAALRPCR